MRIVLVSVFLCAAAVASAQAGPVWVMQSSGTTAELRGIDAVNDSVAWASGTDGTVLRTIDGGAHWTRCTTPGSGPGAGPGAGPDAGRDGATLDFRLDFRGVQALDAQTAVAMSSGPGQMSRIYRTMDGCKTWSLLYKNPDGPKSSFACAFFHGLPQRLGEHQGFGLLLGEPANGEFAVFETRDGGTTWMRIGNEALDAPPGAVAFAASNSCIAGFGGATFDFVVGGAAGSFLARLTYQGVYWLNDGSPLIRMWNRETLPLAGGAETAGARSIAEYVAYGKSRRREGPQQPFSLREVVVGGDSAKPNDTAGVAAWTEDGGRHWRKSDRPPHGYRSAVQYSESLNAWITVGPNGSDVSRDNGRSWQPLGNGSWNALSLPFVVGPDGRIGRLNGDAIPGRGR